MKTTRPCSVPRTTRARATAAPRTARPVALTPRQGKRHLWQAKRASFHLRHDDHVKKGAPHYLNSYPFPLPLSLSCYRDRERGISKGILLHEGSRPRALLLIRGSKAGPSEGFDSRPRARRARDDSGYVRYMAEARATLLRYPRTFPRPARAIL
jgi:hypothetical protein